MWMRWIAGVLFCQSLLGCELLGPGAGDADGDDGDDGEVFGGPGVRRP
jgi:hypothetical protein